MTTITKHCSTDCTTYIYGHRRNATVIPCSPLYFSASRDNAGARNNRSLTLSELTSIPSVIKNGTLGESLFANFYCLLPQSGRNIW